MYCPEVTWKPPWRLRPVCGFQNDLGRRNRRGDSDYMCEYPYKRPCLSALSRALRDLGIGGSRKRTLEIDTAYACDIWVAGNPGDELDGLGVFLDVIPHSCITFVSCNIGIH